MVGKGIGAGQLFIVFGRNLIRLSNGFCGETFMYTWCVLNGVMECMERRQHGVAARVFE